MVLDGDAAVARAEYGSVEELPKKISSSFLYSATRTMYERPGFSHERPKCQGNCVMSLTVPQARTA